MGFFDKKSSTSQNSWSQVNTYNRVNTPTFNYSSPDAGGAVLDLVSSQDPVSELTQTATTAQKDELTASAGVAVGAGASATAALQKSSGNETFGGSPDSSGFDFAPVIVIGGAVVLVLIIVMKGKK